MNTWVIVLIILLVFIIACIIITGIFNAISESRHLSYEEYLKYCEFNAQSQEENSNKSNAAPYDGTPITITPEENGSCFNCKHLESDDNAEPCKSCIKMRGDKNNFERKEDIENG